MTLASLHLALKQLLARPDHTLRINPDAHFPSLWRSKQIIGGVK
jgi:hypothetical protein